MAHHGSSLEDFSNEMKDFNDLASQFKTTQPDLSSLLRKAAVEERLGATNKFPEGKISEHDEGEIKIGITEKDGTVIMNFGKNINWVGFTKEQATQIARSLDYRSGFSMFDWMKKWLDAYEKEHPEVSANSIMNWINQQPTQAQ